MTGNPIILTVDDAPSIRDLVGTLVSKLGFDGAAAGSGAEALNLLSDLKRGGNAPRIIISDLNMPNMNGIDFIKAVRSDDKTTPILMLTTMDGSERKTEGKEAGANGWLVKPISPGSFLAAIKKMASVK